MQGAVLAAVYMSITGASPATHDPARRLVTTQPIVLDPSSVSADYDLAFKNASPHGCDLAVIDPRTNKPVCLVGRPGSDPRDATVVFVLPPQKRGFHFP